MRAVRLHQHLYLRIWLALTAVIIVMTLVLGWLWRAQWQHERMARDRERAQRPVAQVILRDAAGVEVGRADAYRQWVPGQGVEFEVPLADGQRLTVQLPRPHRMPEARDPSPFRWMQSVWGFVAVLVGVALAVALGAYPVVRRLTHRLEALRVGVDRWGDGHLDTRLPVQGTDEIAALATRFNAAADRVQALLSSHKVLLANASHELRSPLARLRMAVGLMESAGSPGAPGTTGTPSAPDWREMHRSIGELDALIDEILLASRLDLTDPHDLANLGPLHDVDLVALAAEECARASIALDVVGNAPMPLLHGSERLLRRLLRNLLENARRYGGAVQDEQCELATATDPDGTPMWRIVVADRGPGVPDRHKTQIFEPFFRLPGASEREGGVGLGLALVRAIAQRHRGHAVCTDRPGGGARFVVDLRSI